MIVMAASSSNESPKQVTTTTTTTATGAAASSGTMESEASVKMAGAEVEASNENSPVAALEGEAKALAGSSTSNAAAVFGEEERAAPVATSSPPPPTYEGTEASETYQTALWLMKRGDFDDALEVVEEGMDAVKQALLLRHDDKSSGDADVHPSMAPYYYLYGTTLLYKVEERELNGPGDGGGVVVSGAATASSSAPSSSSSAAAFGGDGSEDEEGEFEGEDNDGTEEEQGYADEEDKVEDLQIAWEFLESARGVLQAMILSAGLGGGHGERNSTVDKYRADLAQVRKREGDLNRANGLNRDALVDFRAALGYLENNASVGPYDRRVADLHYNLGLLYTLEAAAAASSDASASSAAPSADAAMAAMLKMAGVDVPVPPPTSAPTMSPRQRAAMRNRGVHHFWECSKSLAGSLACLCGVDDPHTFLEESVRGVANLKSTVDDDVEPAKGTGFAKEEDFDSDEDHPAEHPAIASRKLAKLRSDLSQLYAAGASASSAGGGDSEADRERDDMIAELTQLLEEIQETIDEVERSEEGVQKVTEMKGEITAAVAAAAAASAANGDGFGSAAAAASTAAAQPLMAVKKKSKRDAFEAKLKDDRDGYDAKRPAAE